MTYRSRKNTSIEDDMMDINLLGSLWENIEVYNKNEEDLTEHLTKQPITSIIMKLYFVLFNKMLDHPNLTVLESERILNLLKAMRRLIDMSKNGTRLFNLTEEDFQLLDILTSKAEHVYRNKYDNFLNKYLVTDDPQNSSDNVPKMSAKDLIRIVNKGNMPDTSSNTLSPDNKQEHNNTQLISPVKDTSLSQNEDTASEEMESEVMELEETDFQDRAYAYVSSGKYKKKRSERDNNQFIPKVVHDKVLAKEKAIEKALARALARDKAVKDHL